MCVVSLAVAMCGQNNGGSLCAVWIYDNHSLEQTSVLYSCNGRVCFQSRSTVTDWHGSWQSVSMNGSCSQIKLSFHGKGDESKIKSCFMFVQAADIEGNPVTMSGYDYAGRMIYMFRTACYWWYDEHKIWTLTEHTPWDGELQDGLCDSED